MGRHCDYHLKKKVRIATSHFSNVLIKSYHLKIWYLNFKCAKVFLKAEIEYIHEFIINGCA